MIMHKHETEIIEAVESLRPLLVDGRLEEGIEVNWLESSDEWVINHEYTILIEGLESEQQANKIMYEIENMLYTKEEPQ